MESSATLQVDNIRVAALSLAVAVKRGAFAIEEVDEVSDCYKALKKFLEQWQHSKSSTGSAITEAKEKTASTP
jgi:hypothetical protein